MPLVKPVRTVRRGPRFLLWIGMALLGAMVAGAAEKEDRFADANQSFRDGDFTKAAGTYASLAEEGLVSPELFFNLGTSYFRLGQSGEATLWMRRALVVDPDMPEPEQSLEFLRTKFGFLEFAETPAEKLLQAYFPNPITWITSISIWFFLILFVSFFVFPAVKQRKALAITFLILLGFIALAGLRAEQYYKKHLAITNYATITGGPTTAVTAPAPDAKPVIDLPVGSEVRILQQSGEWTYIGIPGELRGWVRKSTHQATWPDFETQN